MKCELYIVEGDSAGGSAKSGRDSHFQAIIPIRGKLINVEKARIDRVLENKEIQSLITAIGCGFGKNDFDISGLRYNRIVIMTDADVDGSHIRTLLLTFFFRELKPLIDTGHIYIANPPLFKVKRKKRETYIDTEDQLDAFLTEIGSDDLTVERMDTNTTLTPADIGVISKFVRDAQHIIQGLHRLGIDPDKYFGMAKDGHFPTSKIIVHEPDGTIGETLVYSPEEKSACIQEAEKRLPPVESMLETSSPNAAEASPAPEGTENASPEGAASPEQAPAPEKTGLHPAIEVIDIYEASACEELGKAIEEAGYSSSKLYHGDTPLFKITDSDETETVNTLSDLFETVKKNGRRGLQIQRYKGLGEMNAEQLWETTMDPARRKMIQVTMKDAMEAERMFTLLMGDDVEPRREYIERHAAGVKDLDI